VRKGVPGFSVAVSGVRHGDVSGLPGSALGREAGGVGRQILAACNELTGPKHLELEVVLDALAPGNRGRLLMLRGGHCSRGCWTWRM
jgi:hypothetical protein